MSLNLDYTEDNHDLVDEDVENNDIIDAECNADVVSTLDDDFASKECEFAFTIVDNDERKHIGASNNYIKELLDNTKLTILQKDKVLNRYKSNSELGLFYLFLSRYFSTVCVYGLIHV